MKKSVKMLVALVIIVVVGIGGFAMHQHKEKEKMIAIATSEEAKKVYEDKFRREDALALTEKGVIRSYCIDENSLEYNPMGGLMVRVIVNQDSKSYINFNLIDNGDDTYHSAYYVISAKLDRLLVGEK
ncbi:DUF1310 family protein [Streptococcus caprae]|uniref:DUF1310 family protein n=1 Tax=Streptococcus caprae TaxID=1640501 RepID=A0ABV8CW42_9STRE